MKESLSRNTANKKKPRGKAFASGADPRRNQSGQRNAGAVAFSRTLRELIVIIGEKNHSVNLDGKTITKKNVEWMIESLWGRARGGHQDAIDFIAERIEGKVTQPIGEDPAMQFGNKTIPVFVHNDNPS